MKCFEFSEYTINMETRERVKVADWAVLPAGLHNDKIIVEKITPARKSGDIIKKVFKVEDTDGYIYKLLKTKINAQGGANGLVDWMLECQRENIGDTFVRRVLNYAWDEMKYYFL